MFQPHKPSISEISAKVLAGLLLLLGGACALPALLMVAGVFWHEGHLSLAHVLAAYSDAGRIARLLFNSSIVTLGTVCVSLLFGVPVGFLCFRTDLPLRRVIVLGSLVAACIPVYVTAMSWMALLGMQFWLYNAWGAAWIQGVAYSPLVVLITGICFAAADREQEEAAALDTNVIGVFRHVSLPQGSWAMAMAAIIVAVLSISDITVTDILAVRTFAEESFTQFQLGAGPWRAAAISFPVMAILLLLAVLAWRSFRRYGESSILGMGQAPAVFMLGKIRYVLTSVIMLVVAAFFLLPIASMVRAVGSWQNLVTSYHTSERELLWTLRITPVATTICIVLSVAGAWTVVKMRYWRWVVSALILLLISVPAPVVGIGLIKLLNHRGLPGAIYNSEAVVVCAYVIRTLPFGILAVLPAVKRIPRELDDLFALTGGNWLQKMISLIVPLCWKAIAIAWLLVFVLAVGEVGASFLVVPPGQASLTLRFFTLIHYGVYPDVAGMCLILLAIVGLAGAGIAALVWPVMTKRFS